MAYHITTSVPQEHSYKVFKRTHHQVTWSCRTGHPAGKGTGCKIVEPIMVTHVLQAVQSLRLCQIIPQQKLVKQIKNHSHRLN